jgi:hypothetical protein
LPLALDDAVCDADAFDLDFSGEFTAISKRKPPSQRPERKLDDTAKAIARARESSAPDKSAEPQKASYAGSEPRISHAGGVGRGGRPSGGGPAPSTSTKRPKQPGS